MQILFSLGAADRAPIPKCPQDAFLGPLLGAYDTPPDPEGEQVEFTDAQGSAKPQTNRTGILLTAVDEKFPGALRVMAMARRRRLNGIGMKISSAMAAKQLKMPASQAAAALEALHSERYLAKGYSAEESAQVYWSIPQPGGRKQTPIPASVLRFLRSTGRDPWTTSELRNATNLSPKCAAMWADRVCTDRLAVQLETESRRVKKFQTITGPQNGSK